MGYEMGFAKKRSDGEWNPDDIVWFSCGWALTGLYRALCGACHFETEGFGECEISLHDLAFIEELGARLRSQHLHDILDALDELDADYVDELVSAFPESVLAAMRLAYVCPDGATAAQREVCSLLCELEENGYRGIALRMAGAVRMMREEGLDACILFAG